MFNLNYRNLQEIPESVLCDDVCKKTLNKLYLKGNRIAKLTPSLQSLESLTVLYLHSNYLTDLPKALSLLPCLSVIDASENQIVSLSPFLGDITSLTELHLYNNKLTKLPDELWRAPNLQCLNVSSNSLQQLSPEIVRCQSLKKLFLDDNKLTWLPQQITRLVNLEHLSLSGNNLKALPNDFSGLPKLSQLLIDMNTRISHIPITLASLSSQGALGIIGCPVMVSNDELALVKSIHTCNSVPSLLELSARRVHRILKDIHSDSVILSLPKELCSILNLPSSLCDWLLPSGSCYQFTCRKVYFKHSCLKQVSGAFCINNSTDSVCKLANLAFSVDFCSLQCAIKCFS